MSPAISASATAASTATSRRRRRCARRVTARFLCRVADELAPVVDASGPAPERLRRWVKTLVAIKRTRRESADKELFETYRTLIGETRDVVADHIRHLAEQAGVIIAAGIAEGAFRPVDTLVAGRAVLEGTGLYHSPAFNPDWSDPATEPALDAPSRHHPRRIVGPYRPRCIRLNDAIIARPLVLATIMACRL